MRAMMSLAGAPNELQSNASDPMCRQDAQASFLCYPKLARQTERATTLSLATNLITRTKTTSFHVLCAIAVKKQLTKRTKATSLLHAPWDIDIFSNKTNSLHIGIFLALQFLRLLHITKAALWTLSRGLFAVVGSVCIGIGASPSFVCWHTNERDFPKNLQYLGKFPIFG